MKTLKLIKQYKRLLEQDQVEEVEQVDVTADATNVEDIPEEEPGISPPGEIYIAELLTDAFIYPPGREEINAATQVLKSFVTHVPKLPDGSPGPQQPRKVIETIERLLEFTDEGLEQELDDLDAH